MIQAYSVACLLCVLPDIAAQAARGVVDWATGKSSATRTEPSGDALAGTRLATGALAACLSCEPVDVRTSRAPEPWTPSGNGWGGIQ